MILTDPNHPERTMGLDNHLHKNGDCLVDIIEKNGPKAHFRISLQQMKILSEHFQLMIKEYEGKNNSNSST